MSVINLVGLAANDPLPGNYVQVTFAQGVASTGQTDYSAVLIGNKLSTGSAGSDGYIYDASTPVQMDTEQDVISLFGAGSELHAQWRAFRSVNKSTSLAACTVAESSGAQADGYVTVSGSALAGGTLRVWCGSQAVEAAIVASDSLTAIGDSIAAAINSQTHLQMTASNNAGAVHIVAKQKGTRGNSLKIRAQVLPSVGVGISVTPTASTNLSGGSVDDSFANALAALASNRHYYYVPACEDATNMGRVSAALDAAAAPTVGLRQRAVFGSNSSSVSAVIALAVGINSARDELVHQLESDLSPPQIGANNAAVYSLMEQSLGGIFSLNFNSFGQDAFSQQFWHMPAPLSGAKFSRAQLVSLLNNGVTPIQSRSNGQTYLVRRITTRSLNGSVPDYRVRDACKVTVSDHFGDEVIVQATTRFAGKVIGNDVKSGQREPGNTVVTPKLFKAMILDIINQYDNDNLLQDVANTVSSIVVVREASPSNRMSARVPLKVIDILNQTATDVSEVSAG